VSGAGEGGIPVTFVAGGKTYLIVLIGTSDSAPLWGGVLALADQDAHHDLGVVNPAIYRIARSPAYLQAFHDGPPVTTP
jgi:subtilase family serine protease